MIINVREERLLVISDIHLGNWFFAANRSLMKFLQHVSDGGYTLCINGDGLDILQTSLVKMTKELSGVFGYVERLVRAGRGDVRATGRGAGACPPAAGPG